MNATEPSTGTEVNLDGLSPNEKLFALFLAYCDPETFNGGSDGSCLIGQTARELGWNYQDWTAETGEKASNREVVQKATGVDEEVIDGIYWGVENMRDLDEALDFAAEELGVSR